MPVMKKRAQQDTFSPKFFSPSLTGRGGKVGLLSERMNPANLSKTVFSMQGARSTANAISRNVGPDSCDISEFDLNPMARVTVLPLSVMPEADTPDAGNVAIRPDYAAVVHQSADKSQNAGAKTELYIMWCVTLFDDKGDPVDHTRTVDPLSKAATVAVDAAGLAYLQNLSAYDAVVEASRRWQQQAASDLAVLIDSTPQPKRLEAACRAVRKLGRYSTPLGQYEQVYNALVARFTGADTVRILRENLNLRLCNLLARLRRDLAQFPSVPAGVAAPPAWATREQAEAICETSPMTLVQSAAGTGKSTVAKERIRWMCSSGIAPQDICVLSFTNAAADHMAELMPGIKSMTIARYVHNIYSANYPSHQLSSVGTIMNSLDIWCQGMPGVSPLKAALRAADNGDMTRLVNHVEDNYPEVIDLLNKMGQTTLEIEVAVCYANMDNLAEPPQIQANHIIIDEVQDNSVFEFVYMLEHSWRHKSTLYLIGDASQTLYEFRAADPRAINLLERSGVFTAHKLQINFRSRQEILDFANQTLSVLTTNKVANLRLQANSTAKVSANSFMASVHMCVRREVSSKAWNEWLEKDGFPRVVLPFVKESIAAGRQVCILAYSRYDVGRMMELCRKSLDPSIVQMSIMPDKSYDSTVMSGFVRSHFDDVAKLPVGNMVDDIDAMIKAVPVGGRSGSAAVRERVRDELVAEWRSHYSNAAANWQAMERAGVMSHQALLDALRDSLIETEVSHNTVHQRLLSQRNADRKDYSGAQVVFCTIHSAKGLEFDDTVVVCHETPGMSEADRRMYYVAFTRAKARELVLLDTRMAAESSMMANAYRDACDNV